MRQQKAGNVQKPAAPVLQAQLRVSACTDVLGSSSGARALTPVEVPPSWSTDVWAKHPSQGSAQLRQGTRVCLLLLPLASFRRGELEAPVSLGINQINTVNEVLTRRLFMLCEDRSNVPLVYAFDCLPVHFHRGRASTPRSLLVQGTVRMCGTGGSTSSKPPGELLCCCARIVGFPLLVSVPWNQLVPETNFKERDD